MKEKMLIDDSRNEREALNVQESYSERNSKMHYKMIEGIIHGGNIDKFVEILALMTMKSNNSFH